MASQNWDIPSLLSIDIDGSVKFPDIRQLLDKDMKTLYIKDKSENKEMFMKELGVVYYLGDPKSPANERGFQFKEALELAVTNFNLPKDYEPSALIFKLVDKLFESKITEAGRAILALKKTLHLELVMAEKMQTILSDLLSQGITAEDMSRIADQAKTINEMINRIPDSVKALDKAYENLIKEKEDNLARGQVKIVSSMDSSSYL